MSQLMKYSLKMPFFGIFRPTSKFKMAAHYCCFEIFSKILHSCAQKTSNFQKNYRPKPFHEVHVLVPPLTLFFKFSIIFCQTCKRRDRLFTNKDSFDVTLFRPMAEYRTRTIYL